tara:strand:- start:234 stop:818 length:585 start_codon:yes stop_codon:yes gene_type:complete
MIKASYFPTFIYAKDVQLDNRLFEKEVIEWSNRDKGLTRTNMKGWHSDTNMHTLPVFKSLVDELFKMQAEICEEEWLTGDAHMGNMWANINPPGGYNRPHLHPNSHFSGAYYIKAPQNSGHIVLNDPRAGAHMVMPNRKKGKPPPRLWREVHVAPLEGRIIMFPAWLWHCVEPNKSNDIRISVSFNFIQKSLLV